MSNYISFYQIINLIALLISLHAIIRKKRNINFFFMFLFFLCFMEIVAANLEVMYFSNNYLSYNICMDGCIVFYYLIYRENSNFKMDILIGFWAIVSIVNTISTPFSLNTETYVIGLIIITIIVLIRFYDEIFRSNYKPLGKDYKTWLGLGITIFLYCSFPLLLFMKFLILENSTFLAFYQLLNIGNIILSTGYLFASIVLWKKI